MSSATASVREAAAAKALSATGAAAAAVAPVPAAAAAMSSSALSAQALDAFVQGDTSSARRCLNDLVATTSSVALSTSSTSSPLPGGAVGRGDPRVLGNSAVLAFYESGYRDATPLLRAAADLLPDDLRPPPYSGGDSGDSHPPQAAAEAAAESESDASSGQDVALIDALARPAAAAAIRARAGFVPVFNAAVVAYQRGRVAAARALTTYLYAHVEAMEDWLALRTCCLAIDVNLRTGDVTTVARIIAFVEQLVPALSSHPHNHNNNNNNSSPATGAVASVTTTTTTTGTKAAMADPTVGAIQSQSAVHFKAVAPPWHGPALSMISLPKSLNELTFCMHIYAARLNAATDDLRMLRKEAKNAVVLSEDTGNCPTAAALLVKAKLEFNSTKSLRVMESIRTQSPPRVLACAQPLLLNNIGVIHHRIGCHALAAVYLERARDAFEALFMHAGNGAAGLSKPSGTSGGYVPSIMAHAHNTHVSYNLGLQHLQLGNYRAAIAMFGNCARHDEVLASTSAMLWIRIAECCVAEANSSIQHNPLAELRGQRQGRRFVLKSQVEGDISLMQYAALSARAALHILDQSDAGSRTNSPATAADGAASGGRTSPPVGRVGEQRCAALALVAYTSLHFDPSAAITACDELVSCSRPGDSNHDVLGRLYGAEALCKLGRPQEASDRLAPLLAMTASSMAEGREGAYVNAALAHALCGDIAASSRAAKAALKVTEHCPADRSPRKNAIMVAAYVSLRDRNMEGARQALRLCC
jgi:tetratricopeptide (TPR) repeat protein